jgi:hypothetical protein
MSRMRDIGDIAQTLQRGVLGAPLERSASMLRRYDIIDVDDLRRAAERASAYEGEGVSARPLRAEQTCHGRIS